MLHWSHQVCTLLPWCFLDRLTTPLECSLVTIGIPGVPHSTATSPVGFYHLDTQVLFFSSALSSCFSARQPFPVT